MTDPNFRWWWQKAEKKEALEKLNLYWDPGRNRDFIALLKTNDRVVADPNETNQPAKDAVDESQKNSKGKKDHKYQPWSQRGCPDYRAAKRFLITRKGNMRKLWKMEVIVQLASRSALGM